MGQKINDSIAEGNLIPPWLFHSDMDRLHQAKAQAKKIPEKYWFKDIWVRRALCANRSPNYSSTYSNEVNAGFSIPGIRSFRPMSK